MNRRQFLTALSAAIAPAGRPAVAVTHADPVGLPASGSLTDLLRDTPRENLLAALVPLIRAGLGHRSLLGALAEAAAREVAPYPVVGFKYHAFMVLQAVHLNAVHANAGERWLPLLWAVDQFKDAQARNQAETGWSMGPVPDVAETGMARTEAGLVDALERWDAAAADAALVAAQRALPLPRLFDILFHYAARDFRHLGHKIITAANCHRLIRILGPGSATPLLRSLVYAIQNHDDGPNPAQADLAADRPWRYNQERADTLPDDWQPGGDGSQPTHAVLVAARDGAYQDVVGHVHERLRAGAGAERLWQALFAAAGELMLWQNGIVSVHANTSCNALHYAFRHSGDDRTRRLLLLQAAAFLPMFRDLLRTRRRLRIDTLESLTLTADPAAGAAEVFAELKTDRVRAARKALAFLRQGGSEADLRRLGRRYTVTRNTGYHDYKFTEAAFENAGQMASPWRERYLAASVLYMNGPSDPVHPFVSEARAALDDSDTA